MHALFAGAQIIPGKLSRHSAFLLFQKTFSVVLLSYNKMRTVRSDQEEMILNFKWDTGLRTGILLFSYFIRAHATMKGYKITSTGYRMVALIIKGAFAALPISQTGLGSARTVVTAMKTKENQV